MKGNHEMKPSAFMSNPLYLLAALLLFVGSAFAAGETVNLNIGTLPPGKSITITYDVMVNANLPLGANSVTQQGTVSGSNFSDAVSDDPDTTEPGDPTVTPIDNIPPVAGFGSAVEFDGSDDYMEIADGGSLNFPAYTIEAWVRLRTVRASAIIFRTDATDSVFSNAIYVNAEGRFVHDANDGSHHTVIGTTTAVAGKWYHVAGAVDGGGTMRLYVNGTEEGTAISAVGALWSGGDRYLAGHGLAAAGMDYLDGWMDEVRIWNAGLSAAQISAWTYRGADVGHAAFANLASYYKLDEAVGVVAIDSTGSVNGALLNMTDTPRVPSTIGEFSTNEDTATVGRFVLSDQDGTSTDGLDLAANLTFAVDSATLGSVSNISGNSFTFTPAADVNGDAEISYRVYDGAHYSASHTATLHIAPVADTPQVTAAVTNVNQQSASGLVISRNPVDGPEVTHFRITGINEGTLYQNDGTTRIDNGAFIAFAQGNAGLKFTPAVDSTATGGFTVQASLSDSDAGLGGGTTTAVITVNRPPAFVGSTTTLTVHQNASETDIKGLLHVSDIDAGQALTWSVSAAPDRGGSLYISNATALSGSPDIVPGGMITYQPAAGYEGSETFAVRVSDGIATATRQITATVASPPTVSGISPSIGPTAGGTTVTITGTNLATATAVNFGGTNAAAYSVDSATRITATSPPGTAGAVHITITTAGGTSVTSSADQFIYVAAPTVSGVAPLNGPTSGGTTVTITGTNLTGATAVRFGGTNAAYSIDSAIGITATSPAGTAGAVDITVTTAGGTSVTSSADQFIYVAPPTVSGVAPLNGPASGGTTVTVTGTNLTGATAVRFGGINASAYSVDSATRITATSPPGSVGTVDITVTTVGGTGAASSAGQFTYVEPPIISGVSPSSGPTTGGTSVTITGTNLTAATAVRFGGTDATISANTATSITAISPAGSAGAVDITVTTAGGTSATSSVDQFTYIATVTGAAAGNGTISCTSPVTNGAYATCTITPHPGYRLTALNANGSDILGDVTLDQVTIINVSADITVTATFTAASYGGRAVTSGSIDTGTYATVHSPDGTQQLVYERDGTLFYRSSSLVSGNWSDEETVAAGHDPSIALKQDGTPVIAFLSNGQIRTTSRSSGAWSAPADTGMTGANSVELAVDGSDALHLAYTAVGGDGYDDILYITDKSGAFGAPATICDGAYASGSWNFCRTPLIKADAAGNYHIVYNKQQINSTSSAHDPQWMVYTTDRGGGLTTFSHDLNTGSATGNPQPLARGAFGHDPEHGYSLVYGNAMDAAGLWLAENLESSSWTESAVAASGTLPVQGNDVANQTRHMAYITPDGRLNHISLTGGDFSTITEVAPSAALPFVNPVKRSVIYLAADTNGVRQIYQIGIDALALLIPADGNLGAVIPGETIEKGFTLYNNGSRDLSPAGVRTDFPGYTFEIGTDRCSGTTLAPGESCDLTVKNSQQDIAVGTVTDTLTITSDDPVRETITLPLSVQVVNQHYPLEITVNGSGTVTAAASGQSDFTCGTGVCAREYDTSSIVTLTTQAPVGYTFTGFTFTADGSPFCRGTGCSVTITGETRITATFTRNGYVIFPLTTGNGTLNCPNPVNHGDIASCTLSPETGYRIEGVGGSCGGTLSGTTYTTLPMTASCTVEAVFTAAAQWSVIVTLSGTGAGGVYSTPSGIACLLGSCSALFSDATAATLTAVPDENSTFGGWSGACTNGAGPCELALTSDKGVTAEFTAAPNAKVGVTGYTTLSEAYTATANGSVIKARSLTFTEALILNGNRRVVLEGGFNAPYDSNTYGGNTLLRGTLTVEKGSLILENLTIR
jgi:hypothetical protein